jgi:hypothetical protein
MISKNTEIKNVTPATESQSKITTNISDVVNVYIPFDINENNNGFAVWMDGNTSRDDVYRIIGV